MTDLSALLNPEQFEAATAPDGPLLILAAAGTGKTRTLVYRVVHLLERGYQARELLLLTFTNRAAREMLSRADVVTGGRAAALWGGTFHSVANRILRHNAAAIGYPADFTILDAEDQRLLMTRCIREAGHAVKDFPKREVVLSLLSGAVNRCIPVAEYLADKVCNLRATPEELLDVMRRYDAAKHELGAMDFDDLLVNVLRLFLEDASALRFYQERFRHVLVDEYQDTNTLQAQFIDLLSEKHRNLSVVGDDYQCIYSWRGSNYRNIMDFPQRYPEAHVVKLERNYRSDAPILELANASIARNTEQYAKTLRPTRENPAAAQPVLHRVWGGREQAKAIISTIQSLLADGIPPHEIAVLYRSHFNVSDLQMQLPSAHIRYRITSGVGFYEQAHIKDMLSLLRVVDRGRDLLSFLRLVGLLPGVGETTALRLWERGGSAYNVNAPEETRAALLKAMPARARPVWEKLDAAVARFGAGSFPGNVRQLLEDALDLFYREEMQRTFENTEEREEEILHMADDIADRKSLTDFLEDVALSTNLDNETADPASCITLSTIHQAKGLEWSVVLIPWVTEGYFPSSRALEDQASDAEERRLFYVAVTRARCRLFLFEPQWRYFPNSGEQEPCAPSRFTQEVPDTLFDIVDDTKSQRRRSSGTIDFSYGFHTSETSRRSRVRSDSWGW